MGAFVFDGNGTPLQFWADLISSADRDRFQAQAGDPAFMAEFELLTICYHSLYGRVSLKNDPSAMLYRVTLRLPLALVLL